MTIVEFIAFLRDGGSFAIIVIFIVALAQGRIRFARESDKDEKNKQELLKEKDNRIADLERRILKAEQTAEHYRGTTDRLVQMIGKSVDLASMAVVPPPTG